MLFGPKAGWDKSWFVLLMCPLKGSWRPIVKPESFLHNEGNIVSRTYFRSKTFDLINKQGLCMVLTQGTV